jgi:hypothetical protein
MSERYKYADYDYEIVSEDDRTDWNDDGQDQGDTWHGNPSSHDLLNNKGGIVHE